MTDKDLKDIKKQMIKIINKDMPLRREEVSRDCLLYTSPSPRDGLLTRMPSSA